MKIRKRRRMLAKRLTALALETARDKASMQKKVENMEPSTEKSFEKTDTKLETLQIQARHLSALFRDEQIHARE